MGYPKEIIIYKNQNLGDFTAIELVESLEGTSWKPTLFVIDKGNEFNWIQLEQNEIGQNKFIQILKDKTDSDEYIGFQLINSDVSRYSTVYINPERILFDINLGQSESENHLFEWFHENLVLPIYNQQNRFVKIEWRTNYDNEVTKKFENI